jgi:2,3-diketo-5-methylthiopentyl-1-phosphate enolase
MMGRLKLIDLAFPERVVSSFLGPKFGIDGIRELLKIEKRPILSNMIKPCTGIPPKMGAKLFYEAAVGGVDIVKDDELLADAPFSHIEERVREFMAAEKRVYEEKGERTLYAVNITDRVDKILEIAFWAFSNILSTLSVILTAYKVLSPFSSWGSFGIRVKSSHIPQKLISTQVSVYPMVPVRYSCLGHIAQNV